MFSRLLENSLITNTGEKKSEGELDRFGPYKIHANELFWSHAFAMLREKKLI